MKKWIVFIGIVAVSGGAYAWFHFNKTPPGILKPQDVEMVHVEKGRVSQEVTANGTIQPINIISVGTQVSGIVEAVYVDYNDEVKKDQLLALIDKSILSEELKSSTARLELAQAKLKVARLNLERDQSLYNENYIAKTALEASEIDVASAESERDTAQSLYNRAERNLNYSKITSPVSGTVISKEVESGQTVAASFQTPTLFTIAEDLSKMQIEASISEADIGKIRKGMTVTFAVDAYPLDTFKGEISQIRLNPETVQNVVMYKVVIDIDNSEKKLLPGMTAFVTVKIQERDNTLRIPNLSLQFRPQQNFKEYISGSVERTIQPDEAVVYQYKEGKLVPVIIRKGIADMVYTEILSGLNENDEIVSELIGKKVKP